MTTTTRPDAPAASIAAANASLQAAIAAHRFGLGEPTLAGIGSDAQGWLLAQVGPADAQRGAGLATGAEGLQRYAQQQQQQRARAVAAAGAVDQRPPTDTMQAGQPETDAQRRQQRNPEPASADAAAQDLRTLLQADVRARLLTAAASRRPFNERLALFWANHFTVSLAKGNTRGVVGAFEREAIRPHIGGSFEQLLKASTTHVAMLRYLDNDASAGPDSPNVLRQARRVRAPGQPGPRVTGLNENLAREVLELHTLGVAGGGLAYGGWGGYTQADVTAFARVLTGWRVPAFRDLDAAALQDPANSRGQFQPAWHEPGSKTVLNKRYAEGPGALDDLLHDLAVNPHTARFVCAKLARHFVADDPPPALVARMETTFRKTDGDLPSVYRTLVEAPEAWAPQPAKLKTPEEFVISSARLAAPGELAQTAWFARLADGGAGQLGQRVQAAPSPAGWPDRAEEWLGPDAVWKRVEWATRVAERLGKQLDARQLAQASLGPLLQDTTLRQIERAADGPQALALLLLAPEFQRR